MRTRCPRCAYPISIVADLRQQLDDARAETTRERLAAAAYCLDRADQYATSSPNWIALADAAQGIAKGEARAALDRGETEDLLERVAKLAGNGSGE